jgi:hypothetical protein
MDDSTSARRAEPWRSAGASLTLKRPRNEATEPVARVVDDELSISAFFLNSKRLAEIKRDRHVAANGAGLETVELNGDAPDAAGEP